MRDRGRRRRSGFFAGINSKFFYAKAFFPQFLLVTEEEEEEDDYYYYYSYSYSYYYYYFYYLKVNIAKIF